MVFRHFSSMVSILLIAFNFTTLNAQSNTKSTKAQLEGIFKEYELVDLNTDALVAKARSGNFSNMVLDLGNGSKYNLELESSNLISPNYSTIEQLADGTQKVTYGTSIIALKGKVKNIENSTVALTLNDGFVYALIRIGQNDYFVEPLKTLVEGESSKQFVFYNGKDIVTSSEKTCAAYEMSKRRNTDIVHEPVDGSRSMMGCFTLEYNYASDFSMFQAYGNTAGVANWVVGVMNNVQTNYDNEFSNQVQFQLGQHFSSTCSNCDPWSSTTDAGDFLESFTNWGPGGFNVVHDLAGIWTNRDFNGSTIGIAWLNGLCNSLRYHALQRWQTNNAQTMRCMVAHEIGHNFGCNPPGPGDGHDASGTWIMSPSVSTSNNWSTISTNTVNSAILNANCLSACAGGGGAPVAAFNFNVINNCTPAQVQYFDQSTNATSRSWSFPGGSPATSTAANPLVTYNNVGTYGATLTASNGSTNNSITISNIITTLPGVNSNFTFTVSGTTVNFTYTGTPGASLSWTFGDGGFSFATNPSHTYGNDGVFTVTCEASNSCSTDVETKTVTIVTAPIAGFTSNITNGCQPLTVNFSNQSTPNSTSYLWTFPGGTPATSTALNPTVIYNNAGTYDVTLKVTNSVGSNTFSIPGYITVNPLPMPGFTSNQSGATVAFTNTSTGGNSTTWAFGDGATSTQDNPNHTYTSNGTFTVVQTVTNTCGSTTQSQTITIAQPPIADFDFNTSPICAGNTKSFINTSNYNPTSFMWEFEGGTPATSTEANPVITYNTVGTYDVRLIVMNSFGQSELLEENVVIVNTTPTLTISLIPDGLTYQFNATSLGGNFVSWDFGDGSPIDPNPVTSHTFPAQGTYTVIATAENSCGTSTSSQVVNVILAPTAAFSSDITTVCASNTVQYTSQSSPSTTSWLWTFEGGNPATSNLENPIVTYDTPGTYDVSLIASNSAGQGSNTIQNYINVITVPTTGIQSTVSANVVTLTNTGIGATSTTWSISGPNGFTETGSGSPINFTAPANGNYSIVQTNTNGCGSSQEFTETVVVNAYVIASMTAPNPICVGVPATFVNTSANSNAQNWTFTGGDPSASTDSTVVVTYNTAGTYTVGLTASNALGSADINNVIEVIAAPTSGFTQTTSGGVVDFTYTGSNGTVTWDFGDGNTSSAQNPRHTYATSGTYTVTQTTVGPCGTSTSTSVVTIIISATNDQIIKSVVYPNPSKGRINVVIKDPLNTDMVEFILSDAAGRTVNALSTQPQDIYELNYEHLASGIYILKIQQGRKVSFTKVTLIP